MNEEFLAEFREIPRREFSDALYVKLNQRTTETPGIKTLKIAVVVTLALVLPIATALTLSPVARAGAQRIIQTIGNLKFDASDEYPRGNEPVNIIASEQMSLEQAREHLPFGLKIPTWTPEGYQRETTVSVTHLPDENLMVMVSWRGHDNRLFLYTYASPETLMREPGMAVGPDSVQEVQVNGKPAALVNGAWNANTRTWGRDALISLLWTDDEQGYMLMGMEQYVTATDLVQMAESLR